MEVKVGVLHTSRELTIESDLAPEAVEALVTQAITTGSPLRLEDTRGNVVLVPAATLAYAEVGSPKRAGVGFGML